MPAKPILRTCNSPSAYGTLVPKLTPAAVARRRAICSSLVILPTLPLGLILPSCCLRWSVGLLLRHNLFPPDPSRRRDDHGRALAVDRVVVRQKTHLAVVGHHWSSTAACFASASPRSSSARVNSAT